MSDPYRNVVPIDASQRARVALTPHETAGLAAECRALAFERLAAALGGAFEHVEDELFALAEKTKDREAQNDFLDARAQARARRPFIEAAFARHFVLQYNQRMKGVPAAPEGVSHELALVDEAELERALATRDLAARLANACEGELRALSQRLAFVLQRPELSEDANPAGPHAVAAAFSEACAQIEAGPGARLALLRALEGPLARSLDGVYGDLNARLVERGILPELRHAFRRASEPAPTKRTAAGDAPAGTKSPASAGETPTDVYSALAQLLVANAAPALSAGPSVAGIAPATQGFVQSLTRLQQPAGAANAAPTVNVIRDLKAAPQGAALAPADSLTIDIVAMLFDFVFEDRQIPVEVKAAIGRLQIPMVKVALLDRSFFSARTHPARRLLNRLAEASIGLDPGLPRGREMLERIEKAVARVLDEFDTDVALFATLAGELDEFLAAGAHEEEALVQRASRLIEVREREEIARLAAEAQVDARLAARDHVPEPVRVMLEDAWARALGRVGAEEGEESPRWNTLLGTVDELLWSLEPKATPEDRRRLVNGLPTLLATLHQGLELAEVDAGTREAFFGSLVDCHAEAVKAGLKGIAVARPAKARPQDSVPPREPAAPTLERGRIASGGIEVEEIRLRAPRGSAPVRNLFTRTGIWTNVQRFSWVEFARGEQNKPVRARLTWISPAKGVYLFTNPHGDAAVSITPEALAEQMRRGEARLIDDAPLVDRAVDSMLASLKEKAA